MFWDPPRAIFDFPLPLLGRPILWYGFLFALGFFLAYWILLYLLKQTLPKQEAARPLADKILAYVVVGAVVGARLGDLLFYQNLSQTLQDPFGPFKIWEGGLASHGGVVGILLALYILSKRVKTLSFLALLDLTSIPTGLVASFIRVGNFINQEILGKPTDLPWAVTFGHPADGSLPLPRHPVQLYEALFYLVVFILMLTLWHLAPRLRKTGRMCGLFLLLVFDFRFLVEFLKEEQSALVAATSPLAMGQILSLPLIFLGLFLLLRKR